MTGTVAGVVRDSDGRGLRQVIVVARELRRRVDRQKRPRIDPHVSDRRPTDDFVSSTYRQDASV
jgi:hypothetical protein